jgi:hypothetical protein
MLDLLHVPFLELSITVQKSLGFWDSAYSVIAFTLVAVKLQSLITSAFCL